METKFTFHPVIANAFSVLSDEKKRQMYDQFGAESAQRSFENRGPQFQGRHPFESEITPEQLFNMFFSSGLFDGKMISEMKCMFFGCLIYTRRRDCVYYGRKWPS